MKALVTKHKRFQKFILFYRPVDESLIRWVLTVPAIWTEQSKHYMREAAYSVNTLPTVRFILTYYLLCSQSLWYSTITALYFCMTTQHIAITSSPETNIIRN